jgi:DNA ligase-1
VRTGYAPRVRLAQVVQTSAAVGATRARLTKIALLAECLRAMAPDEIAVGTAYLSGQLRQRQIGVGYASVRDLPAGATTPTLELLDVDHACAQIGSLSGRDSQAQRRMQLLALFARATEAEHGFLVRLLLGEIRQGALEGLMHEALARALDVPLAAVRRAAMLRGDLGAVAAVGQAGGVAALAELGLRVGQPIQPMLAQSAPSVADALARTGPAAVEWKLDGLRVQIHIQPGGEVSVFSRSLDDITARVPEIVELARTFEVRTAVLDGEALALEPNGRPHPFQVSASRFGARLDIDRLRTTLPLTPFVFDLLHRDGHDLVDLPVPERQAHLADVVPEAARTPRLVTADPSAAEAFAQDTLARGHEGVVVKALDSTYEAGRRGVGWIKVKPVHTLDLVVLAAEWGHGRRRGWLSNLHLGARDPASGQFVMLGKTFKGLTDQLLQWQTARLLELETSRDQWTVHVQPVLVVEIAFDAVQRSTRYPGGVTLRFARVVRYRDDKPAAEADPLATVQALGAPPPVSPPVTTGRQVRLAEARSAGSSDNVGDVFAGA